MIDESLDQLERTLHGRRGGSNSRTRAGSAVESISMAANLRLVACGGARPVEESCALAVAIGRTH